MKIVGLTGGIGSGKTTVAKVFNELGIAVYIADDEAKALMNRSKVIKRKLIDLFGELAYTDNELNRPFIADKIFHDKSLLEKMNGIVHPKVGQHFNRWVKNQKGPYVLKESAILFETNGHKNCDFTILVTAPIDLRIKRVMERDNTTVKKVQAIMDNQLSDAKKMTKADFIIENVDLDKMRQQVMDVHEKLLTIN
ncbi:dephospho-CoA kinase [Hanstruepera neustonica]|uniref:Dephospho-CoA kinase n=1 Tax=Hanstruepera neustonica TaxID=1445657 RepID=A0A2K1DXC6_9FLAO|nr:dephospho-CoA kinase [Hanstruepera neustonica]PNQ72676.1 dephospho-CoA kinase [Hanstruepera neustonica]